ncbi:MAG: peptidylprolyl isomerase, partial [Verrucomicrobiota bacterium]
APSLQWIGRDGFHSVPDLLRNNGDAVERVPTRAFLGPIQPPSAAAPTLLMSAATRVLGSNLKPIRTLALAAALVWSVAGADAAEAKEKAAAISSPLAADLFEDKVVARGKGFEIKNSQVEEVFLRYKANLAANNRTIPETEREPVEKEILDELIATQLLLQRATEADRIAGKETADKFVAERISQAVSEESFNRQLRVTGMTPQQFRAKVLEQAVVKAVIDREIKAQQTVTDDQIKQFYETNVVDFQQREQARVSHILISTKDIATRQELSEAQKQEKLQLTGKILTRARAGEDFAKLVKGFSDDAESKDKGGEYTFARGQMPPEFEAAAFSLQPNQISDVVTTRFGYHIIRLAEKIPARKVELSKVQEQIKERLLQEAVQKQIPDYVAKMRKEAGVEVIAKAGQRPR